MTVNNSEKDQYYRLLLEFHFLSLFILNKQYKICPIEFFIDHKKNEFNYFFNKVHSWTSTMMPTMKIINKIQEYEYHKLTLYKFT